MAAAQALRRHALARLRLPQASASLLTSLADRQSSDKLLPQHCQWFPALLFSASKLFQSVCKAGRLAIPEI